MRPSLLHSLLLSVSVADTAFSPISVSRTLIIDGNPFYLPADPIVTLPQLQLPQDILPLSVFSLNQSSVTGDDLQSQVADWNTSDDVFQHSFLQAALLVNNGHGSSKLSSTVSSFFIASGTELVLLSNNVGSLSNQHGLATAQVSSVMLPSGPYVLARNSVGLPAIYTPYRLFFDETQSFFKSVTPLLDGSFSVVSASLDTDSSPYIGVPSRVYAKAADKTKTPLAGVRVSVKDIYFLKGLRTSAGNRHFYSLYPPRNATGPAVSRLIDLGANIIGVTKTVQFANGDRATADWVDYHAPFVLRGDGNREPSGSSTGAGAGVSALDFVDVGIGTDTGGSIRGPSGVNGLYGIRPSVGAISLEDVVPLNDVLDTGGFIARDPQLFSAFGKAWYAESFTSFPAFPKKILLADDFKTLRGPALAVYEAFFLQLQSFLGPGATIANFSVAEEWNATSGIDVPITTWLNTTYPTMVAFHQFTVVGQPFFNDFAAANGGRMPHVNPSVLARWKYGEAQGLAGYTTALEQQAVFENWTLTEFLLGNDQSCSESLYLYPQNAGQYTSREIYYAAVADPPFGFSSGRVAVHARSPDMVVPIGQIPFNSTISGVEEQLPVTVSIVTRRNCDFMLLDLVDEMAKKGILQTVKTGRTAF